MVIKKSELDKTNKLELSGVRDHLFDIIIWHIFEIILNDDDLLRLRLCNTTLAQ